jgi:uncharacterized membrane protein
MSEEKTNSNPVTGPGGVDQVPAPEEVLSDKLAEQADEVTAQLRDLLPEPHVTPNQETYPDKGVAEPTPVAEARADSSVNEPVSVEGYPPEAPASLAGSGMSESVAAAVPVAAQPDRHAERPLEAPLTEARAQLESSSDDRLMSALAWLTMVLLQLPIVSVIQLLATTTKDRPFQRHHAITSLLFFAVAVVYELLAGIVYTILGALTLGCGYACLWVIFFLPHALGLYYALQAYNGKTIEIPVLSNFARQQGWL